MPLLQLTCRHGRENILKTVQNASVIKPGRTDVQGWKDHRKWKDTGTLVSQSGEWSDSLHVDSKE